MRTRRRLWKMGWARLTLAGLALSAIPVASGVGAEAAHASGPKVIPITFGLSDANAGYMPVYIARDEGFFKKNNVAVTLDTFTGGGSTVEAALASNSVQGVMGGAEYFIANALGVTRAKIIGEEEQSTYTIYTTPGITSLTQLSGKKIGTSSLSGAEFIYWNYVFHKYHVTNPQFIIISGGAGKVSSLLAGAVNAIVDDPSQVPPQVQSYAMAPFQKLPQMPLATIVFNDDFINEHPGAVEGFMKALDEADVWIRHHVAKAQQLCVPDVDLLASECTLAVPLEVKGFTWSATNAVNVPGYRQAYLAAEAVSPAVGKIPLGATLDTQFAGTNPNVLEGTSTYR